jgi:quinol monooxygenase YgiN
MELTIFARLHAQPGKEEALADLLRKRPAHVREQPGCVDIQVHRSIRDARLFYIHARWVDEATFETYAALPSTDAFVEAAQALIDHPFEATRAKPIS